MTTHTLMTLPYADTALNPYMTSETISYHYDKHHRTYVNNLNKLLENADIEMQNMSLPELVVYTNNQKELIGTFNNAAQVLNHDFYWLSMKPNGGGIPNDTILKHLGDDYANFKKRFIEIGLSQFGSGWIWLVQDNITKKLMITKTSNADNPILYNQTPLITCDVWEHAYYIDYRNRRAEYLEIFLDQLVNWDFALVNFMK